MSGCAAGVALKGGGRPILGSRHCAFVNRRPKGWKLEAQPLKADVVQAAGLKLEWWELLSTERYVGPMAPEPVSHD